MRFVIKNRRNGEAEVRFLEFDSVANRIAAAGGSKPQQSAGTSLKVSQALQPIINEMFFTTGQGLVSLDSDSESIYATNAYSLANTTGGMLSAE